MGVVPNAFRPKITLGPRLLFGLMAVLALVLYASVLIKANPVESPEWKGLWVQARDMTTPESIDEVIRRARAGGFNALFVNVFYDGQALYDSSLVDQYDKVESGFDPLSYLVPQAHEHDLQVHAWFVVGRIDDPDSPIFRSHPDWALVGPDGAAIPWLDLVDPQVQRFISDLMMEPVERYEVDGIHFDYTRYPGSEWGFGPDTTREFTVESGVDGNQLRYVDLPAYGHFDGNPLIRPGSAEVLAKFSNGLPAIVLNQYGAGESLLLNWKANQRSVAFASEILQRGLRHLVESGNQIYLLRSETNTAEYGYAGFEDTARWLEFLGWEPVETGEAEIEQLEAGSVLVLPNVYLISPETAAHLADFVQKGGGVIFVDGPTKSIELPEIRALTGMRWRGFHYEGNLLMTASTLHPLIPRSGRRASLSSYREWDTAWREFRMQGINNLIRTVNERVKQKHPEVTVSITITSDQEEAQERYLQDWQTWLQEGYVDFLIPRGYVDHADELGPILRTWLPIFRKHSPKIIFGVIAYTEDGDRPLSKSPDQLLEEVRLTLEAGSNGFMVFDLGRMSDGQLSVLNSFIATLPVARENRSESQ